MITLPPGVKLFLYTQPTDMRRGFDRLAAMAEEFMAHNPRHGNLFLFRNRRGDRLKILYWDGDGFVVWYKRLERGVFRFPAASGDSLELDAADLNMVLGGFDPASVKRLRRYKEPA